MRDKSWLSEYVSEKKDTAIYEWADILKRHYDAFIDNGFTDAQSLELVKTLWKQVDDRTFKERIARGEFDTK